MYHWFFYHQQLLWVACVGREGFMGWHTTGQATVGQMQRGHVCH